MSCFNSNCYLPQPPRAWSRVQNSCSLITDTDNNALVIDPYTGQLVPRVVLAERIAMLNKGNVLQYKANSSNLTKSQKYSKIAQGKWVNRNTTWATQSTRGYTNPNTTSLKRTGNVVNIAIDPITGAIIGPTTEPPTCPQPIIPINNGLPSNTNPSAFVEPEIPPPIPPTPASETFPAIIADTPPQPIIIQDGGVLICSVQENICTGETKSSVSQLCHPTTDSDVPGPIQELCWNDGTQTWYPRQRYVMTNSGNKWPTNAELLSSIKPLPPVITSVLSNSNIVTLNWTQDNTCLVASQFFIFQNGIFIKTVFGNLFTTNIEVSSCGDYEYFIIAGTTGNVVSEPSNSVNIIVIYTNPPTNLSYIVTGYGSILLSWDLPIQTPLCNQVASYNVYDSSGTFLGNTTSLSFPVSGLSIPCNTYSYYVKSLSVNNIESNISNVVSYQLLSPGPPDSPSILTYIPSGNTTSGVLTWNLPITNTCGNPFLTYNLYLNSNLVASNITSLTYTFSGLDYYTSYTYGVQSSIIITGTPIVSSIVTITDTTMQPFIAPGATVNYNSGYFFIIYDTPISSTITFYPEIDHFSVGLTGGGGGGSGSTSNPPATTYQLWGSGGGGGGQAFLYYANLPINQTFNLTVGAGGLGNNSGAGQSGSSSTFDIVTVGGGNGGNFGSDLNSVPLGNSGGASGNYPVLSSVVFASGSGGNGGRGGEWPQPLPTGGSWPTPTYYYAGNGESSFFTINNFISPFDLISIGGGGAGAALQGGRGGNGIGGIPENVGLTPTNFDGQTYGAGGGGYNNNYLGDGRAGNGHDGLVGIRFKWPIISYPFSFDNKYIKGFISPYYVLIFFSSGTFHLTQTVNNCYIVCVGGGGGGGGTNSLISPECVGSGGGGGGAGVINPGSLNSGVYTITVGIGGNGGKFATNGHGQAGTHSAFDSAFLSYISSSGGTGGSRRGSDGTVAGGVGGTVTASSPLVSNSTNNGSGGNGGFGIYGINYFGENGFPSDIYNGGAGYLLPTGNTIIFSGGGGGSKDGSSSYGSGGRAGQGFGGASGWSKQVSWPEQLAGLSSTYQLPLFTSLEEIGESAKIFGGGGGGGGGLNPGGDGGNGLVMLLFTL